MNKIVIINLFLITLLGCNTIEKQQTHQSQKSDQESSKPDSDIVPYSRYSYSHEVVDSASSSDYENHIPQQEPRPYVETKIRFPDYTVVFQDFKGYITDYSNDEPLGFSGQFSDRCGDTNEAILNLVEKTGSYQEGGNDGDPEYEEILVAKKDTVHLSEELFDERIDNTLIQIIPMSKGDRYKVSLCYLASLNEIVDRRAYKREYTEEELELLYKKRFEKQEQSPYYALKDSAKFYFRALPHTPDMIAVTVEDGEVVPVKKRSQEDIDSEGRHYKQELERIKNKYKFRDTLVHFPSEGGCTDGVFAKGEKLFSYGYDSYLFKIERYFNGVYKGSKYVVVSISFGC